VAELDAAHIPHHTLPLNSKNPFTALWCVWQVVKLIRAHNIQLLHARSRLPAWVALLSSRITGVPFITTFHGTHSLKGFGKHWYNSVMVRGRAVIANSQFIQQHIHENYGLPLSVIPVAPRGVDTAVFNPARITPAMRKSLATELHLPAAVPIILMAGRLTRWKGQHVLLHALAELADMPWHCLIVGGAGPHNAYATELRQHCAQLGLSHRVQFLGSRTDLPALYTMADIAISASLEPEAFGRVAVEAQAMGTPIIATNHGGSLETVQNGITGWLIPPNNAAILATTLRAALTNPNNLATMGQAARTWVLAHFTTQQTCQAEWAVYENILKQPLKPE
ncbi:MAG: glycosyltransferase family 4 protein, partial [Alphaproteobacteria bacterium]